MSKPAVFAVGLGLGALVCPIAYVTTMRLCGRHELDPTTRKENR